MPYKVSRFGWVKDTPDPRDLLFTASPVLAAKFLEEFAGEGPWAHIDCAGPAFIDRSRGDYLRVAGGTGWGVRLIAELGESFELLAE